MGDKCYMKLNKYVEIKENFWNEYDNSITYSIEVDEEAIKKDIQTLEDSLSNIREALNEDYTIVVHEHNIELYMKSTN